MSSVNRDSFIFFFSFSYITALVGTSSMLLKKVVRGDIFVPHLSRKVFSFLLLSTVSTVGILHMVFTKLRKLPVFLVY